MSESPPFPPDPRLGIVPAFEKQDAGLFYSTASPGEVDLNHAVVYFANVIEAYCGCAYGSDPNSIASMQGKNHIIGVRLPDACKKIRAALNKIAIHPGPFHDDLMAYYSDMRAAALRFAPDLSGLMGYLLDSPSP